MPGQECLGCGAVHAIGAPACPQCGSTDAVEEGATAAAAASRFPVVEMKCGTPGCPAQGVLRRVPLAQPAPGLIAMPPDVVCASCSYVPMLTRGWPITAGPLGKDQEMPKVTVHGGPSNENPPDLGTPAEPPADDAGSGAVPEPAPEPEPDTGSGGAPDSPARPRLSASRADWEAYAIGAGLPEGDAKGMTKGQLQGWADDPASTSNPDPTPDPEPAGGGAGSESEPG